MNYRVNAENLLISKAPRARQRCIFFRLNRHSLAITLDYRRISFRRCGRWVVQQMHSENQIVFDIFASLEIWGFTHKVRFGGNDIAVEALLRDVER